MTKDEILAQMGADRARVEKALALMSPTSPEKRIAIMTCSKSTQGCTGRTCIWAFEERQRHFEQYKDDELPVHLCAFFTCNGCDTDYANDAGMKKKIERLVLEDVSKIHLSSCMGHKCPNLEQIGALFKKYRMEYEVGTH